MPLFVPDAAGVIVGTASSSTDASVTGSTAVDVAGITVTYTPVGRPLLFLFNGIAYSADGGAMFLELVVGASTVLKTVALTLGAGGAVTATLIHAYTPTAGSSLTWKLRHRMNGAGETGQLGLAAASLTPHQLIVAQG